MNSVGSKIHEVVVDRAMGRVQNPTKMAYGSRLTSHKGILAPIGDKLAVRDVVDAALDILETSMV